MVRHKTTPYQRIMRAAERGTGMRLTDDDVNRLASDAAIRERALLDDEEAIRETEEAIWGKREDEDVRSMVRGRQVWASLHDGIPPTEKNEVRRGRGSYEPVRLKDWEDEERFAAMFNQDFVRTLEKGFPRDVTFPKATTPYYVECVSIWTRPEGGGERRTIWYSNVGMSRIAQVGDTVRMRF